jgi:integrase
VSLKEGRKPLAKTTLTDVKIRSLKPGPKRREIPDGSGLYLVLQPSGARGFAMRYRRHGRPVKFTLGTYFAGDIKDAPEPKIGGPLTLKGARELATKATREIEKGHDPIAAKRRDTEAKEQAAQDTFKAIATEYLKRVCGMKVDAEGNETFDREKKRTGRERHLMLKRAIFPEIGKRPIAEIKRKEIVRLLDKIEDKSGIVASDRVLALVSTIFNWHAKRDDDFATPIVKGMARTKPRERARERALSDDELRVIWKVSGETEGPFPALVRFLLLTAARRDEAAKMLWSEIDGADWQLPKERNKTKQDFVRPLCDAAEAVLKGRPRIEGSKFVFTNDGKRPVGGYSKSKRTFDEAVLKELRKENPKAEPFENWTLHDLRRTARSLMSRAEVNTDHAERCLGHIIGGVRGVYDRYEFYDQKKKAFEALAVLIERATNPPADNVLQFKTVVEDA